MSPPPSFGDERLFSNSLIFYFLISPLAFLYLQFFQFRYGRHSRPGWGPYIPTPLAWFLMESPTVWLTIMLYPLGLNCWNPVSLSLTSFFLLHYFHRVFIYPIYLKTAYKATRKTAPEPRRKTTQDSGKFPLVGALGVTSFCTLNTYLQVRWISHYGRYGEGWLVSLPFLLGLAVFLAGMAVNVWSDLVLISLKRTGGYRIPAGGVFETVSCGNYFGELVEWLGWAIMTWSWTGLGFFLATFANLVPRAVAHHEWYLKNFPNDYPKSRKAIIPFIY